MESKSSIPLESESVALHEVIHNRLVPCFSHAFLVVFRCGQKSTVIHVIAKLAAAIKAVRLSLQIGDQMEFRVLQHGR